MSSTATYCPSCEAPLDAGSKFCNKCGHSLGASPNMSRPAQPGAQAPGGQQAYYIGTVQVTPGAVVVQPKNAAISLLASFFIPGLGTMINGNGGKGALILILYFVAFLFTFILIGLPFLVGIWIWGLVDAYQSAQNWNRAHGIVS